MRASTLSPFDVIVLVPVEAALVMVETLSATATPMPALPPFDLALPLAMALPSLFADERTVTAPPAMIVSPSAMDATEELVAILTAIAAATETGSPLELEFSELGVASEPELFAPAPLASA
jgi:hypothetical protein